MRHSRMQPPPGPVVDGHNSLPSTNAAQRRALPRFTHLEE